MNIKTLVAPLPTVDPRLKPEVTRNVRTKDSGDRDADGRREKPQTPVKQRLTDEEFAGALKILGEMLAATEAHLTFKVEERDERRFVLIEDASGKAIRRLTEADLWSATRERDKATGKIFDKTG